MRFSHLFVSVSLLSVSLSVFSQQIFDFTSLQPASQDADFHLPSTHTFQYLIENGDALTAGGTLPDNCDFAGFVPIGGSSTQGYLSVNSELNPGGVSILDINFSTSAKSWNISTSESVDFSNVSHTIRNCSGAVTPWNTIISCEEGIQSDANGDGFYDTGWAIEIDPVSRTVINQTGDLPLADKLWHMGNFKHENAVIHSNQRTVYQGADSNPGYMYKFVANSAQDLSSGNLYVLKLTTASSGNWILLNNTTQAECNSTLSQSSAVGATVFNGVEDVEISPIDGKIYFAVKNENRVYRLSDPTPINGTAFTNFETYVGNMNYTIDYGGGTVSTPWGTGNDNLAFDNIGNLWVYQDGGNDYIWLVEVGHTQAIPKVSIFGRSPAGSEPTGITFSPDNKFMFMSIQHPSSSNGSSTITDAFNVPRAFDKDVVLVVARREDLGFTLPVQWVDVWAKQLNETVEVGWTTAGRDHPQWFIVDRRRQGEDWQEIRKIFPYSQTDSLLTYRVNDPMPPQGMYQYRIKQIDHNGDVLYSRVQEVNIQLSELRIFPNPARDFLYVYPPLPEEVNLQVRLINASGKLCYKAPFDLGSPLPVSHLPPGIYFIELRGKRSHFTKKWILK